MSIILNYVLHISPGGAKILFGEAKPLLVMGLVGTPFPHQTYRKTDSSTRISALGLPVSL